ncbi:MAG: non-heme iron oxygenase ferredoxin subunit [Nevskia sp.]|nr:non-heme iron oxygenase ferredoxin subunit [Nevskia sp.]
MADSFHRVLSAAEVPPGTKKAVQVGDRCILICNSNQRLYAISNICTHAEKPLERGRMSATWIACPTHGARFDLATGKALNPPAVKPIATYEVRVVDEWIEVLIKEVAT